MIETVIATVMFICCSRDICGQSHCGDDLSDDILASQDAAVSEDNEFLLHSVEYNAASWRFFVFHITGDLTVSLQFRPVVNMADWTGQTIAVPL